MSDASDKLLSQALQARRERRLDDARRNLVEAVDPCRKAGVRVELAKALTGLGQIERDLDRSEAARQHYEEAVAIYRAEGDALRLAHTVRQCCGSFDVRPKGRVGQPSLEINTCSPGPTATGNAATARFVRAAIQIQSSHFGATRELPFDHRVLGASMATAVAQHSNSARLGVGRRFEHFFFSGMAFLMLATVFGGFARTYYLAGVFQAPLPSRIIHIHGAAFSCWILLLVAQTSLVSAHRVDLHRRLGIMGFLLACCMVILGVLAGTNSLARGFAPPGLDAPTFYIVPITDMVIFATLIFFAFRNRFDSAAHKRLILVATIALLTAAIARWPFAPVHRNPVVAALASYCFLLLLAAYDRWSMGKVHRATVWAGAFLILAQNLRMLLAHTSAWHAFATWVQNLART
jgi:hypothetical protein